MKFIWLGLAFFILFTQNALKTEDSNTPLRVKETLYNHQKSETLGLSKVAGSETFTLFSSGENTDKYCNGVVLFPFKGHLYAQWQSSAADEDAEDTWVAYSRSKDGENWSAPETLATHWKSGIKSSGGWWSDGETLIAYINVWPDSLKPKSGYTEYISSINGISWSAPKPILDNFAEPVKGIFEQDPHRLPTGRIINAIHLQPGLIVSPYYTDDPLGISGWTKGLMQSMSNSGNVSREIEPSHFYRPDGSIVMVFRDQHSSFRKLASVSNDNGETWTTPVLTNMPDSRSKQCAGNLPTGTVYLVNNPKNNKTRFPLVITLSKDGVVFDKAFLLRAGGSDLQPQRYNGKYKTIGYSYPKSVIWNNYLYVSYSTNKEDVQLTRLPLNRLVY